MVHRALACTSGLITVHSSGYRQHGRAIAAAELDGNPCQVLRSTKLSDSDRGRLITSRSLLNSGDLAVSNCHVYTAVLLGVVEGLFAGTGCHLPLAPVIFDKGVRNSASGLSGVIAPGEMVTISGDHLGPFADVFASGEGGVLSTSLGGVRALFDGIAAPLLQVGTKQIVAMVPLAVAGKSTVGITVEYGGVTSNTAIAGVLPAVPGLFNQYLTTVALNTPAAPGAIISLFATGAGAMLPPQTDGPIETDRVSIPALPVSVFMGALPFSDPPARWIPLEVTYAGSASWRVSGAIQVNVKLPDKLPEPSSGTYTVALRVGDSLSAFVYVTVKRP